MNIVIINGSPKGARGNTYFMADAFAQGARDAGAEIEIISLASKNIKHCLGCYDCWIRTPGVCSINDDMAGVLEKIKTADVLGYATPLYVDNVTGLMKNFMDRTIPVLDPHFSKDSGGECIHSGVWGKAPPRILVISNSGFPEQSHFQVLKLLFRRIARNMGSEVVAEIYRPGGAILTSHPLILKPLIWKYKGLLKQAGREFVQTGRISAQTTAELEKPIISDETYIKGANESFDKAISRRGS
ncbi:MAG: flavodoxin family protein [Planctomycetota bacterium]